MKKLKSFVFYILLSFLLFACADNKTFVINEEIVNAEPYGIWDEKQKKKPGVVYEPCWNNIIVGIILSPTVVVPLWVVACELYQPVKCEEGINCEEKK